VRACVTTHLCVCGISMRPLGVGRMCVRVFVCVRLRGLRSAWHVRAPFCVF
jgi:hypothetical protein